MDEPYDWSLFTASGNGVLSYLSGEARAGNRLTWLDRDGKEREVVSEGPYHTHPDISPDGKRVAVEIGDPTQGADIWIFDFTRSLKTRFTFGAADGSSPSFNPVWSPDGTEIAYASQADGVAALYRKSVRGTGDAELLVRSENELYTTDWSPDGRFLLYGMSSPQTGGDIWVLPMEAGGEPRPFLQAASDEDGATFSPDGRWVAYHSAESGTVEVYVAPFPGPGRKWQVSVGGGQKSQWRADGQELFFWSTSLRRLMGAEVLVEDGTFQVGKVHELASFRPGARFRTYTPAADGQRFLVVDVEDISAPVPLTLVMNWTSEIEGR